MGIEGREPFTKRGTLTGYCGFGKSLVTFRLHPLEALKSRYLASYGTIIHPSVYFIQFAYPQMEFNLNTSGFSHDLWKNLARNDTTKQSVLG